MAGFTLPELENGAASGEGDVPAPTRESMIVEDDVCDTLIEWGPSLGDGRKNEWIGASARIDGRKDEYGRTEGRTRLRTR